MILRSSGITNTYIIICNIYTLYGREVYSLYIRPDEDLVMMSYTEAIGRPTVLYVTYTMVSVQKTNILPENDSQNDAYLPKFYLPRYSFTCNDEVPMVAQSHSIYYIRGAHI